MCVFLLVLLAGAAPFALAEELPLSVSPSVVKPGDTITVTGEGFQPGATGLVWGGGPYRVGGLQIPSGAEAVSVEGDYAYVAAGRNGLQIVDITNASAPVLVGRLNTRADRVIVEGGYAYVANNSGLQIINIELPEAPEIVGRVDAPVDDFALAGGYAYVVQYHGAFQIIDVREASSPRLVASLDTL